MTIVSYKGRTIVDGILQLDNLRWKGDLDLSFCTSLTMMPEGLRVRRSLTWNFVLP